MTTYTPWGHPQDIEELADGVLRVATAGHGGLVLSWERWNSLPAEVRASFFNATYAEEDFEEPIALTLLGIGSEGQRERAIRIAEHDERYAPALPYLRKGKGGGP